MKTKILIVGGNGFVGSNIAQALRSRYSVFCTYRESFTPISGIEYVPYQNLSDKDQSVSLMMTVEPSVVIYAAGSNDLMAGEKDSRQTLQTHSTGATMTLAASEPIKAKYIYLSGDSIFSGQHGNFSESDTAIPNFQVGKAKMTSENYIRSRSSNHVIIRAAPLLGRGTLEHPSWIDQLRINEMLKKKTVLAGNRFHNPVHISVLTDLIERVIESDYKNKTFHVGGLSKLSDYELGLRLFEKLGLDAKYLEESFSDTHGEINDFSINFSQTLRTTQIRALTLSESIAALL